MPFSCSVHSFFSVHSYHSLNLPVLQQAAAMLRGGCGGNDVARGNGTMGDDDDDNDGDGSMGDGVTGYDDNDDDDR